MISMRFWYSSMKLPTASRKRCSGRFCRAPSIKVFQSTPQDAHAMDGGGLCRCRHVQVAGMDHPAL